MMGDWVRLTNAQKGTLVVINLSLATSMTPADKGTYIAFEESPGSSPRPGILVAEAVEDILAAPTVRT